MISMGPDLLLPILRMWKSVKMIKFECNHDLQVFSSWMEQNYEVLVIFKFWPKSHTRTLAEIFKLTNFEVSLHSLETCESQSKWSNSNVKMIYKCLLDEWKRIKKFWSLSSFDLDHLPWHYQKTCKLTNFGVFLHSL